MSNVKSLSAELFEEVKRMRWRKTGNSHIMETTRVPVPQKLEWVRPVASHICTFQVKWGMWGIRGGVGRGGVFNSATARNCLVSCQRSGDVRLHVKSPGFSFSRLGSASRRSNPGRQPGDISEPIAPEVICRGRSELNSEPGQALTKPLASLTSSSLR